MSQFVVDLRAGETWLLAAVRGLGVHRSNLSRWRAGQQGVSVETAQRIRAAIADQGVSVELGYFFDSPDAVVSVDDARDTTKIAHGRG